MVERKFAESHLNCVFVIEVAFFQGLRIATATAHKYSAARIISGHRSLLNIEIDESTTNGLKAGVATLRETADMTIKRGHRKTLYQKKYGRFCDAFRMNRSWSVM